MASASTRKTSKTKIPKLTPKEVRLLLLQEETKKKRAEAKAARRRERDVTDTDKVSNIVEAEALAKLPLQIRDDILEEDVNVIFKPNPGPQTDFLAADEKEVFYGGARGGGKSYSLL